MEPVDYIKIFKNHWKVVVALVLLAVVAIFLTSPKSASKAYSAEYVMMLQQAPGSQEGATGLSNIALAAMLATTDSEDGVPARVAKDIGYQGKPGDLAAKVKATGDTSNLPLLHVTATAATPAEAMKLANAFGDELIKYIDEQETARTESAANDAATEATRIQTEINNLNDRINAVPPPPDKTNLEAQVDAKTRQLGQAMGNEDSAGQAAKYTTMRKATDAHTDASFVAGASRAQRSLFAAVVAALLGFGVAIMLDRSDSRLRTKEAAERHFGLPVLAEIPLLGIGDRSRAAVVAFEKVPRVAEAYRSLRTALLLFRGRVENERLASNGNGNGHHRSGDPTRLRQLVVVTSPEAGDGKSTTTANLAMAYAETGQSVLLVSWDLWRPLSPDVFGSQEGPGVSDYLDGHGSSLVRYVQDTSIPGVRIVTAGLGGHHPTAQIEAARRLLEEARTLANVVIVDTAPILSASVTRELVTLADAVVVVCRSGRTTSSAADRCAELLERLGAPTLGVVLVGVPTGPFADYYGAPPKGGGLRSRLERGGNRPSSRRSPEERSEPGGRHKAPASRPSATAPSSRPTAAQYRATTPRAPDGGREPMR
jgi:capsular exopolysaccharide synthesis family protein